MIELRVVIWPNGREVLQYRVKELIFPVQSAMDLQNGDNWRWGDWLAVPRVEGRLEE